MLVPFSSSSPVQAPLRGPVRPAIYLMAYTFLVFPSKPFSMQQPECSFKNILVTSPLKLLPIVLRWHSKCSYDLQGLPVRPLHGPSLMPSLSPPPCPDSPEDWPSLSQHHVLRRLVLPAPSLTPSLLSLSSMSSLQPPNLNLPHSPHIFTALCTFSFQVPEMIVCVGMRGVCVCACRDPSVRTLLWAPCCTSPITLAKWIYSTCPSGLTWLTSIVTLTEWELTKSCDFS